MMDHRQPANRRARGRRAPWAVALLLGLWGTAGLAPVRANDPDAERALARRVVHRFDFDERRLGNLESLPKFWNSLRPKGFPHYTEGGFDEAIGHRAPPSFHLASEGRNVAFVYAGPETHIRTNTDYRVEGYVRPDRLIHARACLTAHFVDRNGSPIVDTLVRSRYVGGDHDEWARIDLYLGTAPRQAYAIALTAWVLRESVWNTSVPPTWHIPRADVHGGAWFDDIAIFALPYAKLTTNVPGHVLSPDGLQELHVTLADNEDPQIYGVVSIHSAKGELVETQRINAMVDAELDPAIIDVSHLRPGLYHVRFDVYVGHTVIVTREISFARLSPFYTGSDRMARGFGAVIDPGMRGDTATELMLLLRLGARAAKLPVWSGLPEAPLTIRDRRQNDLLLQELVKNAFALTAVFAGPPSAVVRADGAYVRPLFELLAGERGAWSDHLAMVVAPYAGVFRWWQVGAEESSLPVDGDTLETALVQLRDSMQAFVSAPQLSLPVTDTIAAGPEKLPVEGVTLRLTDDAHPQWYRRQLESYRAQGYSHVFAYIEAKPAQSYRRLPRLADWAQRLILARHAGADTVFVPQPWRFRQTPDGAIAEPTELYPVFRTISDLIGHGRPGPRIPLDTQGHVYALAFHDGDTTTLALWDTNAPPQGRQYTVQLGQASRVIDLWGRSVPLRHNRDGRHLITLTSMPVFVDRIERWLIDFRMSLVLTPDQVESGSELQLHQLTISNKGGQRVAGEVRLDVPEDWSVTPRTFNFNLASQRTLTEEIKIHYPHNEPAGRKTVLAKMALGGDRYYLEVPLTVEIGLTDLEISGLAVVEGTGLLLRHVVTNRSTQTLSFRGSAAIPGRARQYRPISNLRPGDTQVVEYRFAGATDLSGRGARLMLREVNDGPRIHNLEIIIP